MTAEDILPLAETRWWHIPHDADMGIGVVSPYLDRAFEQAALAMTRIITEAPVASELSVDIQCQAPDVEGLLVDWLNELVFEMATRNALFGRFQVQITGLQLTATAWGEPVDQARHHPAVEVKGATYTDLLVQQDDQGLWQLRCILDV